MDYRAYKPFQGKNDREQLDHQQNILKEANIVFSIGPKLEASAKEKIRGTKKAVRVVKIQPGLADIEPVEMPFYFSAITFGRVNRENTLLKQINLAVASFGRAAGNEANSLGEDPRMVVIGLSEEEQDTEYQSLKSLVEQYAGKAVSIHGWLYDNNRDNLFKELKGHSVCMMLSISEAFGLVGLEAISAGIPLILSQNTGLYKAITQPPPNGLGITYPYAVEISGSFSEDTLPSKDIQEVVKHLYAIATNKDEAKRKAIELREKLYESWTWENSAYQVLKGLGFEENNSADISDSDTSPQNKFTIETRSESAQTKSEIVLIEQKNSEGENQLPDTLKQNRSNLQMVVNHPVRPKPEVPKFKKEIINLIQNIKLHLKSLDKSELKRILERDLPYPAMFEAIASKPTFIRDILTSIRELSEQYNNSSQAVLLSEAYELANRANRLLDTCFQEILTLKKASSRKSSSYTKKIDNLKHLFNQIEQQLATLVSYLEESVFQDVY
jgi:hypothetical protein